MANAELDSLSVGSSDDIQIPSTPPSKAQIMPNAIETQILDNSAFKSPPPQSSSMTPPPSSQLNRFRSPMPRFAGLETDASLASPPATVKNAASGILPTADVIAKADIEELRTMVQNLMIAVSEARMSAAHFKLQHNLLTMESQESAQRAEVEHNMTRREVEVLQAADHRHRLAVSQTPRGSQTPAQSQSQIDTLTKTCDELEQERDGAEKRLRKAKKIIELEKDRSELLMEENMLLKKRIRENREHFSRMKSVSPIYATPRDAFTTPQRKAVPRFADSTPRHEPFAALLAADQVLSQESMSVPGTPTHPSAVKLRQGHTRGAHSLSSLHSTPARGRHVTSDGYPYSAPGSQLVNESAERERHDRDSTISVSDDEDNISFDDVPHSQASSLATQMLRKNPGSQESLRMSQTAEQTSNLLQTKLLGKAKKAGVERSRASKRQVSSGEAESPAKKAKLSEGVGLGIGSWNAKI
jgi:hypothetical protein